MVPGEPQSNHQRPYEREMEGNVTHGIEVSEKTESETGGT